MTGYISVDDFPIIATAMVHNGSTGDVIPVEYRLWPDGRLTANEPGLGYWWYPCGSETRYADRLYALNCGLLNGCPSPAIVAGTLSPIHRTSAQLAAQLP